MINLMKNTLIAPTLCIAMLLSTVGCAQTQTASGQTTQTKTPPPYGDNPNIFRVFAHKTSDKVLDTAEKVGDATERGVAKIKPKVDQAWDNVTAKHTVDVPIEHKALGQSSSNEPVTTAPVTPSPAAPKATQENINQPTASQPVPVLQPDTTTPSSNKAVDEQKKTQTVQPNQSSNRAVPTADSNNAANATVFL